MAARPPSTTALLRLVAVTVRASNAASSGSRSALLYAWRSEESTASAAERLPSITAAASVTDGAVLLAAHAREFVERRLANEWRSVETAKPGTLKNRLHALANAVLKRSDPIEAALARIPRSLDAHSPAVAAAIRRARGGADGDNNALSTTATTTTTMPTTPAFEILHPASVDPRLVRRVLRRLCQRRAPQHQRGARLWIAALLPQAPLSVLPLPNVTVYYTLWRVFMHASAATGAKSLLAALDRLSEEQRRRLGLAGDGQQQQQPQQQQQGPTPLPAPVLVARDELPSPLTGLVDAQRLADVLEQPHLIERFEALMRRQPHESGGGGGGVGGGESGGSGGAGRR
jgi:hypothetical protein